jgi:nucleotide-binding universal stress UspA family protein
MDKPYGRIACCIERDEMAEQVLREGLRMAGGDGSALHIVHVVAPPHTVAAGPFAYVAPIMEMRSEAEEWLAQLTGAIAGATPVVLEGSPTRELCAWTEANRIDLIIAAAHRGLLERAMLGGFASYVAYHAPCPVLLIHRPADAPSGSADRNTTTERRSTPAI